MIDLQSKNFFAVSKCTLVKDHWEVAPCNSSDLCKKKYSKSRYDCLPSRACESEEYFKDTVSMLANKSHQPKNKNSLTITNVQAESNYIVISLSDKTGLEKVNINFDTEASTSSKYPKDNKSLGFAQLLSDKEDPLVKKIGRVFMSTCP